MLTFFYYQSHSHKWRKRLRCWEKFMCGEFWRGEFISLIVGWIDMFKYNMSMRDGWMYGMGFIWIAAGGMYNWCRLSIVCERNLEIILNPDLSLIDWTKPRGITIVFNVVTDRIERYYSRSRCIYFYLPSNSLRFFFSHFNSPTYPIRPDIPARTYFIDHVRECKLHSSERKKI